MRTLRNAQPGHRFRSYVDERRKRMENKSGPARLAIPAIGLALIVVGLAIGWLPGPGGFVAIIGLALIAQEVPWVADLMDRSELLLRQLWRFVKRLFVGRELKAK